MRSVEKDFLLRGHDPQLCSEGIPRTQNPRTFIESLACVTHCEGGGGGDGDDDDDDM